MFPSVLGAILEIAEPEEGVVATPIYSQSLPSAGGGLGLPTGIRNGGHLLGPGPEAEVSAPTLVHQN